MPVRPVAIASSPTPRSSDEGFFTPVTLLSCEPPAWPRRGADLAGALPDEHRRARHRRRARRSGAGLLPRARGRRGRPRRTGGAEPRGVRDERGKLPLPDRDPPADSGRDARAFATGCSTEVRLLAEAAAVWKALEEELDGPLGVHFTGGLMVAETPSSSGSCTRSARSRRTPGSRPRCYVGEELRSFAPYLADDLLGAALLPAGGSRRTRCSPLRCIALRAVEAAPRSARTRRSRRSTSTRTAARTGSPCTPTPGAIDAHRMVNAAGAWANETAALLGLQLPAPRRKACT